MAEGQPLRHILYLQYLKLAASSYCHHIARFV